MLQPHVYQLYSLVFVIATTLFRWHLLSEQSQHVALKQQLTDQLQLDFHFVKLTR